MLIEPRGVSGDSLSHLTDIPPFPTVSVEVHCLALWQPRITVVPVHHV